MKIWKIGGDVIKTKAFQETKPHLEVKLCSQTEMKTKQMAFVLDKMKTSRVNQCATTCTE